MSHEKYETYIREYEQKCDEIRMRNETYLEELQEELLKDGFKYKTVNRHLRNVDFYINTYLLREEPLEMIVGASYLYIDEFFGDFFIRKCMWSTPGKIKSTAESIKKFYKSMFQRGHIEKLDYVELTEIIKDSIYTWLEDCEIYNDPDSPNPFSPF